jgi:hypothetical protein
MVLDLRINATLFVWIGAGIDGPNMLGTRVCMLFGTR